MTENTKGYVPLSEQAYWKIREKIVRLELPPGSVIRESDLMEELGLGRTPIREALHRLAQERLVEIIPRRGIFVTPTGLTDLQRLFEVRVVLEGLAARLAAERATDEQLRRMEQVLATLPEKAESPYNYEKLVHIDRTFHHLVYEATHNPFLQDILTTLYALSQRIWHQFLDRMGDVVPALGKHRAIYEAIRSRDAARAERLLQEHVREFYEMIKAAM